MEQKSLAYGTKKSYVSCMGQKSLAYGTKKSYVWDKKVLRMGQNSYIWDKKVLRMGQKSLTYGTFKIDVLLVHVLH